jgi:hypothetical protein
MSDFHDAISLIKNFMRGSEGLVSIKALVESPNASVVKALGVALSTVLEGNILGLLSSAAYKDVFSAFSKIAFDDGSVIAAHVHAIIEEAVVPLSQLQQFILGVSCLNLFVAENFVGPWMENYSASVHAEAKSTEGTYLCVCVCVCERVCV